MSVALARRLVPRTNGLPVTSMCARIDHRREERRRAAAVGLPSQQRALGHLVPGVLASAAVMQAGFWGAEQLGPVLLHLQGLADTSGPSPISGIPVTILLGFALRNNGLIKLPMERLKAGLELSKGTLLRAGIICIGAKLSLVEIANVGLQGVPAVMAAIGTGMLVVPRLGRAMGLSTKLSSLVAAGTSICGVTAISALSPTIRASEQETAVAVANVVAFGTLNMLLMPHVAHALFASSTQAGAFLGLSVHDTAQVMGAALTYNQVYHDEIAMQAAVVTKLTRNVFLAAAIPALAWTHIKADSQRAASPAAAVSAATSAGATAGPSKPLGLPAWSKSVPPFVLGFLGLAALRSGADWVMADTAFVDPALYQTGIRVLANEIGSHYLLGTAMAAVGLSTSVASLRGIGPKPFILGACSAGIVAGAGFVGVAATPTLVQLLS